MEKCNNETPIKETLEKSGTHETEVFEATRTSDIVTPPARANTANDIDFIDELDELFGVSLDSEADQLKNLHIDDIPLDGKSPDLSSESEMQDNASDDEDALNTDRLDYIMELEKVASQSDVSDTERDDDEVANKTKDDDEGYNNSRAETRETDTITPKAGLGYTTRTCTELQMSTWHSTLVTDCESASRTGTSGEKMISEAEATWNDTSRMSSGKKSAVKFYEEEEDDDDDVELSRYISN